MDFSDATVIDDRPPRMDPETLTGLHIDGRYLIVRQIAAGGMGVVYLAEQTQLARRVAIKALRIPQGYEDRVDEFERRFLREAAATAHLTHPNIVKVYDHGAWRGTFYLVMEYIEGKSLSALFNEVGPLGPARMIHIARQVCAAVEEAHHRGLVHRDLKPSNIMLTREGRISDFVKVLDFGLVKICSDQRNSITSQEDPLTRVGDIMGSPGYIPPEQINSEPATAASDVYSLGAVMYRGLTGQLPFRGATDFDVLFGHLHHGPPPFRTLHPGYRGGRQLESVVHKCLAKNPAARFASMHELSDALRACQEATPPTVARRVARIGLLLVVAALLALASWFGVRHLRQLSAEPDVPAGVHNDQPPSSSP